MVAAVALALAFLVRSSAAAETISATSSAPPASAASSTLRVLVRVDTHAAVQHVRLPELIRNVQAIWKPYADIVFADIADLAGDGYDDEISLVVAEPPGSAASGASALGWITFVSPGQPANVVTVSVATARNLMSRSSWMGLRFERLPMDLRQQLVTRAVGWSAAHEIGHYLLRTGTHSKGGLMEAELTALDVMRNDRKWVQLAPGEVEILRRRASRTPLLADTAPPPAGSE